MERIQIDQVEPTAYEGLFAIENYLAKAKLSTTHKHLIKIRASQINRCAFCIDMHTKEAIKDGESPQRIFLLNSWEKTDLFSQEERIVLQMTEEITNINEGGLSEDTYQEAISKFDEQYFSQIIMAIGVINFWNRIAVSTLKPLPNS
ncbi:carboxymuconolactone decarboxylase family protein [Aquimarina sp. D1M17]|uniref:carboxymuconolactone decarboxylase family protein n=1 Tax=Aquimarina acroporae TaxID=2937283 RepID=UPI0020C007C1|nr:carboxymuconolactone decarboxylase family protein [Aquimarina acroporae]MCK8521780.1 carboxymuconolactone decarboxylase family protein [Aquimarina acroporae]